ncbi:MAG: YciI family protein [Burkholderiaceae bacterium]
MRYMIIVRADPHGEAAEMAAFHAELARAGVLLDANRLRPSSEGWRIRYGDGQRRELAGPFAGSQESIAAYTLIQVRSREEALAWARRFPAPGGPGRDGGEIELRLLSEPEECRAEA